MPMHGRGHMERWTCGNARRARTRLLSHALKRMNDLTVKNLGDDSRAGAIRGGLRKRGADLPARVLKPTAFGLRNGNF